MQRDVPWRELGRERARPPRVAAVARGFALGVPLLLLFGGLFVAADAVFQNLLSSAVPGLPDALVAARRSSSSAIAWMSAGLLRDLLATREDERRAVVHAQRAAHRRDRARRRARRAVNLLFLAFVLVQLRFLFGGRGLVESAGRPDVRASTHGTASSSSSSSPCSCSRCCSAPTPCAKGTRAPGADRARLSACLVVLVGVVMASALQRLWLYQQQFGLTELRIYATGVVLWLAVVFVWLGRDGAARPSSPVRDRRGRRRLRRDAVHQRRSNPDALIARTNLTRPQADVSYLGVAERRRRADAPRAASVARSAAAASARARAPASATTAHESALSWNLSRQPRRVAARRAPRRAARTRAVGSAA